MKTKLKIGIVCYPTYGGSGVVATELGIALIVMYCIMKILEFYGIGLDEYAIFAAFYLFLAMCHFILRGASSP